MREKKEKYAKKVLKTTLALIIIIAGCTEKERYPERYLDAISIQLHMDRPAEIAGRLRQGVSPSNTLEYPDLTGTSRISFECGREDSTDLAELLQEINIPFLIYSVDESQVPFARYWQEGISWAPIYDWHVRGDSCTFTARVVISNSTGREWFSRSTMMMDENGYAVCMLSDTLLIRNGDMELGWWNVKGRVLPLTLSYGWPIRSQWNQLLPCAVPAGANVGSLCGSEWPIARNDTLWIQPDEPLEITERVVQNSTGYDCTLLVHNQTDNYYDVRVVHPEETPRGAEFLAPDGFPEFMGMQPGDLRVLEYSIEYN